ncbi:PAS domain S-box protein [Chloroflexota bacterium]
MVSKRRVPNRNKLERPQKHKQRPIGAVPLSELKALRVENQRLAEESRESAEWYKDMYEVPHAYLSVDLDGHIKIANRCAIESLGYSQSQLVGRPVLDLFPDTLEGKSVARIAFHRYASGEIIEDEELQILTAVGKPIWISLSVRPFQDISGKIISSHSMVVGITERKRTKDIIHESEEKLRLMYQSISDGIITTNLNGDIQQVSNAIVQIFGYSNIEELTGLNLFDFIVGRERKKAIATWKRLIESPVTSGIHQHNFIKRDGQVCCVELNTSVLPDSEGVPQGFITLVKDVSARKHTAEQLITYQKELRALTSQMSLAEERERRRIAIDLHDRVGHNLATCSMQISELKAREHTKHTKKDLEELHTSIRNLIKEIRSLTFEFSSPILYELGFEAAIEHLTEQFQDQHHVLFDFNTSGKVTSISDDIKIILFRIIRELLVNIIKHAKASRASVDIHTRDDDMVITVADDGIGFNTSIIRFNRKTNKGLGIFSIYERLHYINGDIKIESRVGQGTKVIITIEKERLKS